MADDSQKRASAEEAERRRREDATRAEAGRRQSVEDVQRRTSAEEAARSRIENASRAEAETQRIADEQLSEQFSQAVESLRREISKVDEPEAQLGRLAQRIRREDSVPSDKPPIKRGRPRASRGVSSSTSESFQEAGALSKSDIEDYIGRSFNIEADRPITPVGTFAAVVMVGAFIALLYLLDASFEPRSIYQIVLAVIIGVAARVLVQTRYGDLAEM